MTYSRMGAVSLYIANSGLNHFSYLHICLVRQSDKIILTTMFELDFLSIQEHHVRFICQRLLQFVCCFVPLTYIFFYLCHTM